MHRFTLNLRPTASARLAELCGSLDLDQTQVVHRALAVLALVEKVQSDGGVVLVRHQDGTLERVVVV